MPAPVICASFTVPCRLPEKFPVPGLGGKAPFSVQTHLHTVAHLVE
ncbi:MAG: hypothetical protein M1294_05865 [Firmicutes bacterium]|nr:hypothetical protein [Bacillota bacterium]